MSRVIIFCITLIYGISMSVISQSLTDVRIVYPDDTILINLTDKEVQRIERKTRSYIEEFACDQILFDNSKSYSLDSAQTYSDMQFINAINKIPNNLLEDMVGFCGMNISRKGFSLSADISLGNSHVLSETMNSLPSDDSENYWAQAAGFGLVAGVNTYYNFNNNLGVKGGLNYSSFESTYSLKGEFADPDISIDINEMQYYKIILAGFDSLLNIKTLTIPLLFNFTSSNPGKNGIYIETGILLAMKLSSTYHSTGDFQVYGYYPDSPAGLQIKTDGQSSFYEDSDIDRSGKLPFKTLNFSAYISLGMNIALGYYSSLKIGPELIYGLTDLDRDNTYIDIFGNTIDKMPTLLKKFSLKLSYIYKL